MSIEESVKEFVRAESRKPSCKYGRDIFDYHIVPMVGYAERLAAEHGADREIVMLASWMHDVGSMVEGRVDHHISGSRIAGQKLAELSYPEGRTRLIQACIMNHRGSQKNDRVSLEEKIVAEADVLSNFENIGGLFKAAYEFEGLNQDQAQSSVKKKLQNKFNQLYFDESKKMITPKYEAAMLLLTKTT